MVKMGSLEGVEDKGPSSEPLGEELFGDSRSPLEGDVSALMEMTLVGRIIVDKPFNKVGLQVAIFRSWHFVPNLVMEEVEGDMFIFSFPSAACRQRVLDLAPWNIKGFPLVLKPWCQGETVHEVDLSKIPIWVQVHGLPLGQNTRQRVEWAARKIGEVMEVDFRSQRSVWVAQYTKAKVFAGYYSTFVPWVLSSSCQPGCCLDSI